MPNVSVIMSVHNNEQFLKAAVESILNQTYKDFEFIITNDCSTDSSLEILRDLSKKDKRIILIENNENLGLTASLNNMINLSKGKFIARMDGDDIAFPYRIEKQLNVFENNTDIGIVFTDEELIDKDGNKVCDSWKPKQVHKILEILPYHCEITHPSVMIKKSILMKHGLYNTAYRTGQDKELWLRLLENKVNFYYLKEKLLSYRINPQSVRKIQGENYYFKLAKTCVINNQKRKALKYLSNLNLKECLNLFVRMIIPFPVYYSLIIYKVKMDNMN